MKRLEEKGTTKRRGRKSYYYKFFLSFIMVLFVPMLTIALIFVSSQSIIREQILSASQNTLNQFFQRVDDVVGEAQDICVTIVNNSDSKASSKKIVDQFDKRAFYAVKIQQQLKTYMGEKYLDIFEYYPGKDYVISANNSAMNLESYYKLYYKDKGDDFWEEFKSVAETSDKKPVLLSMNGRSSASYLCVAMRQLNYKDEKYDYVLVVVLRPGYVTELLENMVDGEQNGVSMIMNADEEGIFSTDDIVYEENFKEEDYMIQKRQSKVTNACYVYAVPHSYFWNKLFHLYIICGIGTAVSVALGIFIAFRQTNKVYQPVGTIVSELQQQASITYDAGTNTEFEFIKMLFDKEKREKLVMNKTIRQGEVFQRTNFIFSLLNGSNEISEMTEDIFTENGLILNSDYFCVTLLRLEQEKQLKNKMTAFVVTNVLEELCNRKGIGYVIGLSDTEFVVLVNLNNEDDKSQLVLLLEEGKVFLSHHYDMNITMGISSVQEGMQGIHTAYKEAEHALAYSYLLGKGRIIDYLEIAGREFRYLQAPEVKMLHVVTEYLAGSMEEAAALYLVEELTEAYGIDKNASLETMECFEFEAVSMFHRCLMQEGLWTAEWRERIMKLLDQTTLEDFKIYFAELLMQLYRKKQEKAGEQDVCAKVKEYIEDHYREEQLSRTQLSELFGIAPGYLSKLFKEKYQFTIPEYISRTRVDNAKLQLRNTDCSVQEIAEKNGFVNSASFIRTFKRQEGITPNVYREFFDK